LVTLINNLSFYLAMSLVDVILSRRSIRKYENKDVPNDVLNKILEAGRQSPSAANRQPYHFIVVTDDEIKKEMPGLVSTFIKNAPLVIVGCANPKALLTGKWAIVDTTIALENMVLAAWSLGVGSCWIGAFNEQKIKDILQIPKSYKVVALLSLGYPAEYPKARKKKEKSTLFSFNKF
jgi:nitroreductase